MVSKGYSDPSLQETCGWLSMGGWRCKREIDFGVLFDSMLVAIKAEVSSPPVCKHKKLDAAARDIIIGHQWLGYRLAAQLPAFEQHLASEEKLALKTSQFRRI